MKDFINVNNNIYQPFIATILLPLSNAINRGCSNGAAQKPTDQAMVVLGSFQVGLCLSVDITEKERLPPCQTTLNT